jgi:hypothetical protein
MLFVDDLGRDAARHEVVLLKPGGRDADLRRANREQSGVAQIRLEAAAQRNGGTEYIVDNLLILVLRQSSHGNLTRSIAVSFRLTGETGQTERSDSTA